VQHEQPGWWPLSLTESFAQPAGAGGGSGVGRGVGVGVGVGLGSVGGLIRDVLIYSVPNVKPALIPT
jgi:hypothetical protein